MMELKSNVASSIMGIGEVIAVGPEVKMVKPGDEVMYDIRSMLPMPIKFDEDEELMPRVRHISANDADSWIENYRFSV